METITEFAFPSQFTDILRKEGHKHNKLQFVRNVAHNKPMQYLLKNLSQIAQVRRFR
jgi:hypothetical protein